MKLGSLQRTTPTYLRSLVLKGNKYGGAVGLVKLREGLVLRWYKDTLGKWTGGYGHLRKPGEESLVITKALADRWIDQDLKLATASAQSQFSQLPIQTQNLLDTLVSVNFQLGSGWYKIHKKTWALLLAGDYLGASREALRSLWYIQTPIRVQDLVDALVEAHSLGLIYNAKHGVGNV